MDDIPAQVAGMERELQRELSAGHSLFGLLVKTLARRQDCDDVLLALQDGTGRVAVVHLIWTYCPPERLPWPGTTLFQSLEIWGPSACVPMPRSSESRHRLAHARRAMRCNMTGPA
jgi:hypothetical protein